MAMTYPYATPTSGAMVQGAINDPQAPRTIASAGSRMDALNERLSKARAELEQIANMIGGPHPAVGVPSGSTVQANPISAVQRLNDSADYAHSQASEIESLISAIARALG